MRMGIRDVAAQPKMMRRVIFTVGTIIGLRLLYLMPVPGVQMRTIFMIYQQHVQPQGGSWVDVLTLLHAGKLRVISLFALGLMPYVNACIITQIVMFLVPGLQARWFSGRRGHSRLFSWTVIVALILSVAHAAEMVRSLEVINRFPGFQILNFTGLPLYVSTIIAMSAAVMFLIFWSEVLNGIGIGNGVGVIFFSEVLIRLGLAMHQMILMAQRRGIAWPQLALLAALLILFVYGIRLLSRRAVQVPFATHAGEQFVITMRPEWVGVWPVIMGEAILSMFGVSLSLYAMLGMAVIIVFFNLLFFKIVYQPRRFYEAILEHHCVAVNMSDSRQRIEDMMNQAALRSIVLSTTLLLAMYFLPLLLPFCCGISFLSAGMFGTFGVIILSGVVDDIAAQARFFRAIRGYPLQEWKMVQAWHDEPEAQIQAACLHSHGVTVLLKPSHFIWGLPIGTVASQYALYVPAGQVTQARTVLEQLRQERCARAL